MRMWYGSAVRLHCLLSPPSTRWPDTRQFAPVPRVQIHDIMHPFPPCLALDPHQSVSIVCSWSVHSRTLCGSSGTQVPLPSNAKHQVVD
nr:hypothetical protein CFP56_57671 [Quercus suber]